MSEETFWRLRERAFSVTDFGGSGAPVLLLHGNFGRATTYAGLAGALVSRHRVVGFDQRGHGRTGGGGPFGREEYVADAAAAIDALGLGPVAVVGHSMGGLNAYQLAARYPHLVRGLVVEEACAVYDPDRNPAHLLDVSDWPTYAASPGALGRAIEARGIPDAAYFLRAVTRNDAGWRLSTDHAELMESQLAQRGDWWPDWLGSRCPALLVRGADSVVCSREHARAMADRRADTQLVELEGCGHFVHDEAPSGFQRLVGDFLERIGD